MALEAKWRDLEPRANPSLFQSWTWTGCLARERFSSPVLVEACQDGRTVALALFNRRGRTLHLGASGDPALDSIYIEYNGVMTESGREAELTVACLLAARRAPGLRGILKRHLILRGIDTCTAACAAEAGDIWYDRSLISPFVALTDKEPDFLNRRSANTRQQLRRSDRHYAAIGGIMTERAETLSQAYEYLDELRMLHQRSWTARGEPGAFSNPFFGRFHHALIACGLPRGEIDLLRVVAGPRLIGVLYNFRYRERVLAYQSGFDYSGAGRHGKPGLTCHHQAVQCAMALGPPGMIFWRETIATSGASRIRPRGCIGSRLDPAIRPVLLRAAYAVSLRRGRRSRTHRASAFRRDRGKRADAQRSDAAKSINLKLLMDHKLC
ncbi:MAG: GNAT family N-acetyltransferase [Acetobacteraceae bacterium]|nr:GNAT family N-acetyltransferase [Acetobacteraceae bacterium]